MLSIHFLWYCLNYNIVLLMNSNLSVFIFIFVYFASSFGVTSKKTLPNPKSQIFTPMFYSKHIIILLFPVWCMMHFEWISVWYKKGVQLYLHGGIHSFQYHLLKRHSFLIESSFHSYWKSVIHICNGYFPDSQFNSNNLYVYPHVTVLINTSL